MTKIETIRELLQRVDNRRDRWAVHTRMRDAWDDPASVRVGFMGWRLELVFAWNDQGWKNIMFAPAPREALRVAAALVAGVALQEAGRALRAIEDALLPPL